MYPQKDNDCDDFQKSAGKSIDVLVKMKNFKHPLVGNYWHDLGWWSVSGIKGNVAEYDIEEWYAIPEMGTGEKLC